MERSSQKKSRIELHGELPFWPFELGIWAKLPIRAKAVYPVLITYASFNKQHCWPSLRKIAERAGICHETVRSAVKDLENAGLIFPVENGGPRKSNSYTLRKRIAPELLSNSGLTKNLYKDEDMSSPRLTQSQAQSRHNLSNPELTEPALMNEHHSTTGVVGSSHPIGEEIEIKLAERAQRHTDHIVGVQPGWDRQQTYQAMLELVRIWDNQEVKEVIEKYGQAAENVGLIKHYLKMRPTIEDKKSQQRKREKERQDRNRNWEESKKNAAPLEAQHEFFQKMITMTKNTDATKDAI